MRNKINKISLNINMDNAFRQGITIEDDSPLMFPSAIKIVKNKYMD